ncbi:MAG: hypothetical protein WA667_29235 [Candidatus Nitrosopolaris sp.]
MLSILEYLYVDTQNIPVTSLHFALVSIIHLLSLAASQPYQGAYHLEEQGHSIFTYYLLEDVRRNEESVDSNGYVTPYSLNRYIYKKINSLSTEKRPRQKPLMKAEASEEIILASYPELRRKTMDTVSTTTPDAKEGVTPPIQPTDESNKEIKAPIMTSPPIIQKKLEINKQQKPITKVSSTTSKPFSNQ